MKKIIFTIMVSILILSSTIFVNTLWVGAEEEVKTYFTAEQYTDSDKLLKADGTLSERTIRNFADDVNAALDAVRFPELVEVVPRAYLESSEKNAVFSYNGKEYGFYLVKREKIFDLLLIDFVYEFEGSGNVSNQYKIRIEPILQESFDRIGVSVEDYEWRKSTEQDSGRDRYYISNPRFLTVVQNENALNYGDFGYAKQDDDGLIILQTRTNYSEVQKMTGERIVNFVAEQVFDVFTGEVIPIAGKIIKAVETFNDFLNLNSDIPIEANNEENIIANETKEKQRENPDIPSYSRVAGFIPKEDMILSAEGNSYAEFIVVLNESNYRTRLTQICDFDIVMQTGIAWPIEEVPGPAEDEAYTVYRESVLFAGPTFEIPEDDFETTMPIYLLPHGDQPITFKPEYSGRYIFEVPAGVDFSVEELSPVTPVNGKYIVQLEGDTTYHIRLKNTSEETILNVLLTCTLENFTSGMSLSIPSGSEYIIGYTAEKSGVVKIASNQVSCHIKVLDEDLYLVKQPAFNASVCYCELEEGQQYYIVITNTATLTLGINPIMREPESYELDEEISLALQNEEVYINFTIPAGNYVLTYTDNAEVSYMDCTELVYKVAVDTVEQMGYVYLNTTETKTVSFGFKGAGGTLICLTSWTNAYTWEVTGEATVLDANTIRMKRGAEAEIRLRVGPEYVGLIELKDEGAGYSYGADEVLTIAENCRLTNEADSTTYPGLLAVVGGSTIATLRIQVVHDITSIKFTTYNDDIGFEMYYGKVSNVSENAQLHYTIETPFSNYDGDCTLLANGGQIDIEGILDEIEYHGPESFIFHVQKIVLIIGNYLVPIYTDSGTSYQHIQTRIPDMTCNIYFLKGEGNANSPFEISCLRHLNNMEKFATNIYYSYKLMTSLTINDWEPIAEFKGYLDLNLQDIYFNATISGGVNYGFIDVNKGTIKRASFYPSFTVQSTNISGTKYMGVICAENYGTIDIAYIRATVKNPTFTATSHNVDLYVGEYFYDFGAIAGYNEGVIDRCCNYASIGSVSVNFGGIVGLNYGGTIRSCSNYGDLFAATVDNGGGSSSGGIVGLASIDGTVEACTNYGDLRYVYETVPSNLTVCMGQIAGKMCNDTTMTDPLCLGTVAISLGVFIDVNRVTSEAVGYYYDDYDPESGCVAPGTLITLADGTQKPVELLTGNEMLLVWNLFTGTFDTAPILFIDSEPAALCEVINLTFSDGTKVEVIYEHAFWDFNLDKYVFLRADAAQYIGHWFNKQTTDAQGQMTWTKVQLMNVTIEERYTTAWSPVTYGHLCYYVNGMLSMPGATEGLINIFEVNEQMKIDEAQMQADIETYGLFTYEEFYALYPVPETIFEAFNGQYLKISIGKGLLSYETLGALIERYSEFF